MEKPPVLPDNLAACQALIVQLAQRISELGKKVTKQNERLAAKDEQLAAKDEQIASLQVELAELLQRAFRNRSERYLDNPQQLKFDFGNTDQAADAAEGLAQAIEEADQIVVEYQRRRRVPRKPRNGKFPAHFDRYEVKVEAPEAVLFCPEHGARKPIGYDTTETLEYVPPRFKVRVTHYPKFVCEDAPECGVAQPQREPGLVEGNRYDTSVAATIITDKVGYHQPIYREQDRFASGGWSPSRGTLLNIQQAAAELIRPFALYLRGEAIASGLVATDETRVTLLLPKALPEVREDDPRSRRAHEVFTAALAEGKKSVSARMWAYRSVTVPVNVFDFTVSRHRDGPDEFLVDSGFTGAIVADCYSGYHGIALRSDARIVRAACNAHARRKFFDARESYPLLSSQFLAAYHELYDVEDRAKTLSIPEREALREREARPVWERMRALLDGEAASRVLPKEKFSEALGYLRNQWDALQVYLTDGRLPFDNNETEQLMKQVAIGRKNWLFIGSVAAGQRAADLLTVVSSAVRNDLDVWYYVKDVLDKLLAGSTDYAALRPDRWAATHPDHLRAHRADERADRASAQHHRRSHRRAHPKPT